MRMLFARFSGFLAFVLYSISNADMATAQIRRPNPIPYVANLRGRSTTHHHRGGEAG
jgi:hypothetical protein